MSEQKNDSEGLLGHEYDGIRELDNQLPNWWVLIFIVSIIWGACYWGYYTFGHGDSQKVELEKKMAAVEAKRVELVESHEESGGEGAGIKVDDSELIAKGQAVFSSTCASCHGQKGEGSIGPNLTDPFWIHGDGSVEQIIKVVKEGVVEKGMPPWGPVLSADKIEAAAVFIFSLKGSNPPNAKAPQGDKH